MFRSLVHDNNMYSDVERFHYMLSYLSGPALTIVKTVQLTAEYFSIAWNALKYRYDNQCLLVTAHIEKLFTFAPLKRSPLLHFHLLSIHFVNIFQPYKLLELRTLLVS